MFLDCHVIYCFGDDGLIVVICVRNVGSVCCFYGMGVYLYFMVGMMLVDDVMFTLPVAWCFDIDDCGILIGSWLVDGMLFDLC